MNKDEIDFSVIGLGHFGYFWAKELSKHRQPFCFDINNSISHDVNSFGKFVSVDECLSKDIIFITIPIRAISEFLKSSNYKFKPGSLVVDCASVKLEVHKWYEKYLPSNVGFALTHPLFGPDSAKNGLDGHQIAYTGTRNMNGKTDFLLDFFTTKLGLSIIKMTEEEHDKLMAYNLSLVHLLGRALNELHITEIPLKMNALKHMSQITEFVMNDNIELFEDFFNYNPYAGNLRAKFIQALEMLSGGKSEPVINLK